MMYDGERDMWLSDQQVADATRMRERFLAMRDMDPRAQRLLDWAVPGHINRIEQLLGPDRGE